MSSYSSASVTSYATTRTTSTSSNNRLSLILASGYEIYMSKDTALNASSSSMEMDKEHRIVDTINSQVKGNKASVVLSSTEAKVEESIGMNCCFHDPSKRTRENLDESSDSDEEPHIS